jgi:hypothetical protein
MFAPQPDKPPSLRQGDVIADVFFPLSRPGLLKYLATYDSGSDLSMKLQPFIEAPPGSTKKYVQAISHGIVAHGAVISQCCDLDRAHPRTSFSLCRLVRLERSRFRNVEALINNIDPWGAEKPHFQFFYVGSIGGLDGEYLADFGLLSSFSWADYGLILGKKVYQLDDLNRNKFRVKVGAFFGRPTDEDTKAGLANPYDPAPIKKQGIFAGLRAFFRT